MKPTIAELQTAVNAETTVENSVSVMLEGLATRIALLKTAGTDPATASDIDALVVDLNNSRSTLAACVVANAGKPIPAAA